ncbi:MAG: SDR family NAD(P)-dependent oxidoreductase, partial [Bacteroidota bacterium]
MKNEKVVLITGSTSGIGLGIARQFAKSGYKIVFNGLESNGAEVAENIGKEFGIEVMFSSANLTNVNEIENMIN